MPVKHTAKSTSKAAVGIKKQQQEKDEQMEQLTREREFYFQKLREIEIYCQGRLDLGDESVVLKEVQGILYKTEDGFEQPE